jgi:hypothetical protein
MSDHDQTTLLTEAKARADYLAEQLNVFVAGVVNGGLFDATYTIHSGGGEPQCVSVQIKERSRFDLELRDRRPA